jgi:putative transcriptional regulator
VCVGPPQPGSQHHRSDSHGQLESELADDSWILEPAREDDVFTDEPDLLWSRVLQRKGPEYRRLSRMPYDPSMN